MPPETRPGLPREQQPTNIIRFWWKLLLTHRILLATSIVVGLLIVGGITVAVVRHSAEQSSSPSTQTAADQNAGSSNDVTPPSAPDKTDQNKDTSKGKGTTQTPQKGSAQTNPQTSAPGGSTGSTSGSTSGGTSGGSTQGCAVASAHVPDGPDGMGGCWPGPSNTGPNAAKASMAAYSGSCTINSANVTIDSKVINCSPLNISSGASNVVIKNSYIMGGVINQSTESFTIQDSLVDNGLSYPACSDGSCSAGTYACGDPNNATFDCGVGYKNFTILRTEIVNTNRAAYCESTCTIEDSYFHGTNLWPDVSDLAHASSVRAEQYLTLRHNSLGCDYTGPFPNGDIGCSADLTGYPDFAPIMHNTIDKNLFLANNIGNGYCAYGGGTLGKPYSSDPTNATYISFTNNIFQAGTNGKCGAYGAATDFIPGNTGNVWSNNKFDDGSDANPS